MIESRYKIEYILPDEDVKKRSSFQVIWFLFLIPVVLILVTAITYDFSIKDISRDSSILVKKIKTEIFNLGSQPQLNNKSAQSKTIANISNSPTRSQISINQDKIQITELTKKQELQLQEIQKQMAANKKQTQNLNRLSEKLALEQTKNQRLNSQLASQEKDRLELEEQLNRITEESAITKAQLESLNALEKKRKLALKNETIKEKESVDTLTNVVEAAEQTETKQSVIQSETDKIIETMVNITPSTDESNKTNVKVEASIGNKEISSEKQQVENEEVSIKKTVSDNQIKETETPTLISIPTTETEEVNQTIAAENDESEDTEKISNTNSLSEQKSSINTQTIEKQSAIDSIIAAMQEDKASSGSNDNNNAIEIEKENTQELAEKDKE